MLQCRMVMVQGEQQEVVNVSLGIKQVAVKPCDATVTAYIESLLHEVCVYPTQPSSCII